MKPSRWCLFMPPGVSDFLDGKIARRHKLITNFGILMDPLADKIMVCSAFIAFVGLGWMPAWMVVIVVARELAITGLRLLAASKSVVLAAEGYGKHKTISQIVAISRDPGFSQLPGMGRTRRTDFWAGGPGPALDLVVCRGGQIAGRDAHIHFRRPVSLEKPGAIPRRYLRTTHPRAAGRSPNEFVNRLFLWIAQGFGVGRFPVAPGTLGSLLGLLWFVILLWPGSCAWFAIGALAGLALSVWLCGLGEKQLGRKDPGSIVLDEIAAVPLCFIGWLALIVRDTGRFPDPAHFFSGGNWLLTLGILAIFRLFDVIKPWPVRQSQSLSGGWGITVDDVLAAAYVNAIVLAVFAAARLREV